MRSRATIIIILILSLIIRLPQLDFPLSNTFRWGDGTRDYLIANHIVTFKEFPLLGPFNLLADNGVKNSPVYYYLLALFLVPNNNILILSILNILLQLATLVFIYLLTRKLFDKTTAIIALCLFNFNPEVLHQADFIWQPHVMQTISYLSLYLTVTGFLKSNRFLFWLGASLFAFAIALHNSAFSWMPLFLILAYKRRYLLSTLLFFSASSLVFYLPVIIFYLNNKPSTYIDTTSTLLMAQNLNGYLNNLHLNFQELLNAFGLDYWTISLLILLIFLSVIFAKRKSKKPILLILSCLVLPIASASLFNKTRLHYLTLAFGALTIISAQPISFLLKQPLPRLKIAGGLFFVFFFQIFSFDLKFLRETPKPLENQKTITRLSLEIEKELLAIQKKEGFASMDFFQVVSYHENESVYHYPILDTLLLVPLEEKLGRRLTQTSDLSSYNHIQVNENKYFVLSCPKFSTSSPDTCLKAFFREKPNYTLIKEIRIDSPFTIYLAKRSINVPV